MKFFEDLFGCGSKQAPVVERSTGGGAVSLNVEDMYANIYEGQPWIAGTKRLKIKSPTSFQEYGKGVEYEKPRFFGTPEEMRDELKRMGAIVDTEHEQRLTEAKSQKNTLEGPREVLAELVPMEEPDVFEGVSSDDPKQEEFIHLNTVIRALSKEVGGLSDGIFQNIKKAEQSNLFTEAEIDTFKRQWRDLIDNQIETIIDEDNALNALVAGQKDFSAKIGSKQERVEKVTALKDQLKVLAQAIEIDIFSKENHAKYGTSALDEVAPLGVDKVVSGNEGAKVVNLDERRARLTPKTEAPDADMDQMPSVSKIFSVVDSKGDDVASMKEQPALTSEPVDIVEVLGREIEHLNSVVAEYTALFEKRRQYGWMTDEEDKEIKSLLSESENEIALELAKLKKEKVTVKEGKKRLKALEKNLPIEKYYQENDRALRQFVGKAGEEEARLIDTTLRDAMITFFKTFEGKTDIPFETLQNIWVKEFLPNTKKDALQYMQEIVSDEDMNRKAIRAILTIIARDQN